MLRHVVNCKQSWACWFCSDFYCSCWLTQYNYFDTFSNSHIYTFYWEMWCWIFKPFEIRRRVFWRIFTEVTEELSASIFRMDGGSKVCRKVDNCTKRHGVTLRARSSWYQNGDSKFWRIVRKCYTRLQGVKLHEIWFFMSRSMRNIRFCKMCGWCEVYLYQWILWK